MNSEATGCQVPKECVTQIKNPEQKSMGVQTKEDYGYNIVETDPKKIFSGAQPGCMVHSYSVREHMCKDG